jgi:hypothetical protein
MLRTPDVKKSWFYLGTRKSFPTKTNFKVVVKCIFNLRLKKQEKRKTLSKKVSYKSWLKFWASIFKEKSSFIVIT